MMIVHMSGPASSLHIHLRAWRRHRGLTLEQTANIIGSKLNTISGWETGSRTVDLDDLEKLAKAYGVEPAALLYAPDDQKRAESISTAGKLMSEMDPKSRDLWIEMGRRLTEK